MIFEEVKRILNLIRASGTEINGTLELNNIMSEFYPNKMTMLKEEISIENNYSLFGNWTSRQLLEKNHYWFLTASIIHKIGEVQYFHKQETLTSRKFIIFSNDCISAIQFISRPEQNLLNIFIRSSDVLNLLCSDYLFGCKLLNNICEEFHIKNNINDKVTFFTTSSHFYLKDKEIVDKILGNKNLKDFIK